jgi:hypothetical protein
MNLSVLDRVVVLTALPKEGDYVTLKILMELRMALSFTEEEIKKWKIKTDMEQGMTTWDGGEDVEIPMGEKATDIIVDAFKKLDSEKHLASEMLDTYEKFITTT